jgi:hypothetical protein
MFDEPRGQWNLTRNTAPDLLSVVAGASRLVKWR